MRLLLVLKLLVWLPSLGFAASAPEMPPMSGVNDVKFRESSFDNDFAGNAFLIEHQGRVLAVTVKHALLIAKTDSMKTVDLEGQLASWRVHPNGEPDKYIELGRLLNADPTEALDPGVIERDWLVFEVQANHSPLQPLKLRADPVVAGERLFAVGCSYAFRDDCSPQRVAPGTFISYSGSNLLVDLDSFDASKLGGLSGSPVVDADHHLVGIVSNVLPHPSGKGDVFAPASLDYLRQVLAKLPATKASRSVSQVN